MNTLNFNDADLKANREGRLSDAQQRRMESQIRILQQDRKSMRWLLGMLCAIIAIAGMIIVIHDGQRGSQSLFADLTVYARISVIFIGLMGLVSLRGWWSLRALTDPSIHIIEGTVDGLSTMTTVWANTMRWPTSRQVPLNTLQVHRPGYAAFEFHFADKASLRHFKNGKRYRVYYLPYAMPQALSAEEIAPEKVKR